MNVSAKTEYACLAGLELALQYGTAEPVRIRAIAETHGIPHGVLAQVLLQLKTAGLVASTRGASGGYQLLRDPAELSLLDVMTAVEGELQDPVRSAAEDTAAGRALLAAWKEAAAARREVLSGTTFADLARQVTGATENMYYI